MIKRIIAILMIVITSITFASCSKDPKSYTDDIITQKEEPDGKIPITVLVKHAFAINSFEAAVEKKFPDINLIQVGNYTTDMGISEYEARLEHDDLTDIVMTWPLDVGKEYWADRLMDLSSFSFTTKYNTKSLNDISQGQDGKLFYLPGPSQIRGIIYNKTMFTEKKWTVPNDFEGFISLCKQIEADGIRSLQLGLKNQEVLDTAFIGYGYSDCYSTSDNARAISKFDDGLGSFRDNYAPALETFKRLIDEGILKKTDLDVNYPLRETMMFSRQCAMIEDSVLMAGMGESLTGTKDEFALMPFFNEGENNDWSRLYPVCFIGANKHLEETKNKQKYDAVMKILEYISSVEGQTALLGDNPAAFSSLKGMPIPNIPEIADLVPSLSSGRYGVFPTLKNAMPALREGLAGMVAGTTSIDEVIEMVDNQNTSPPIVSKPAILGEATEDFTLIETGNYITDIMRDKTSCDIALFLDSGKDGIFNGKGVCGKIYSGQITSVDIKRIMPGFKAGDGELWTIKMTGENLIKTLEYSIPVENDKTGWFYYFSGLKMEFAPSARPGNRIRKITDLHGKDIDPKKLYSVAIMNDTVKDEYISDLIKTEVVLSELFADSISKAKKISPSSDNRFIVIKN